MSESALKKEVSNISPVQMDAPVLASAPPSNKKNRNIIILSSMIGVLLLIIAVMLTQLDVIQKILPGITPRKEAQIAKVGDVVIFQAYLDIEKELFLGEKNNETDALIKQKMINDAITLKYAKDKGWITDLIDSPSLSQDEYLKRIGQVQMIKERIESEANHIAGSLIVINFYQTGRISEEELNSKKEIALAKITAVYNQVKNKEITIADAGQKLREDAELEVLDRNYKSNVFKQFNRPLNQKITGYEELNDYLLAAAPGELTPIYMGRTISQNQDYDSLYVFGQVDTKIDQSDYTNYSEWLELKRKEYKIVES